MPRLSASLISKLIASSLLWLLWTLQCSSAATASKLDPQTGLVVAEGYQLVVAHCSACHSPALVRQNNMRRERWLETIRWMQRTQKLWPLGDAEPQILDYLEKWYGPKNSARRPPLAPHLLPGGSH